MKYLRILDTFSILGYLALSVWLAFRMLDSWQAHPDPFLLLYCGLIIVFAYLFCSQSNNMMIVMYDATKAFTISWKYI